MAPNTETEIALRMALNRRLLDIVGTGWIADSQPGIEKIELFYLTLPPGNSCLEAIRLVFSFDTVLFIEAHPVDGIHISSSNNLARWQQWQEMTNQPYRVVTIEQERIEQERIENSSP